MTTNTETSDVVLEDAPDRPAGLRSAAEVNDSSETQRTADHSLPPGAPDSAHCVTGSNSPTTDTADTCQQPISGMGPLDQMLTTIERREILSALSRANGQRTLAARLLGISRSRLYRRMEALGIDPREIRSE